MPVAAVFRSSPKVSSKNHMKEPTAAKDPLDTHTTNLSLTLADQTFEAVRELMQHCENRHERCREISVPAEETRLPKRLINCTNPKRPRLVDSSEDERGRYVALSYVWGGDQPYKTIQAKLSKYQRRIPMKCLPRTIRDAIWATHELGFELLWVDSLCIVQDAESEKQHEIGRMHHIFRHAALTIVAASAHHAWDRFLHDRLPLRPSKEKVSIPILSLPGQSTAAPRLATLTVFPEYILPSANEYRHEPTSQRAWCLQEQLMSPRSLLFSSHGLRFKCQTNTRSIGASYYNWEWDVRLPDPLLLQTSSPPSHGTGDWHRMHSAWQRVVGEYTCRSMTEPSDKLVACAAIADAFHRVLNSDYLAGLWRHSLLTDLLWFAHKSGDPPTEFRAPSWSWAAVDGRVSMVSTLGYEPDVAEVIRCDVSLVNDTLPFGEVSGGSLVLRAPLLQLQLGRDRSAWRMTFRPTKELLQNEIHYWQEDSAEDLDPHYSMRWEPQYSFGRTNDSNDSFWAIPLARTREPALHGLIVARVQPSASGSTSDSAGSKTLYCKIGTFQDLQHDSPTDTDRLWIQPLKNQQIPLKEIEIV